MTSMRVVAPKRLPRCMHRKGCKLTDESYHSVFSLDSRNRSMLEDQIESRRMLKSTFANLGKAGKFGIYAGRKFVSSPGEAFLLFRMAWWVGVLSAAAKWGPLPKALKLVSGGDSKSHGITNDEIANRLAGSIDLLLSTDFLFLKPICWKRVAVLRRYLSKNGFATRIIFGVRNDSDGKVIGHAWLESDGKPFLEKSPPDYVVTYSFPSEEPFTPQLAILTSE